jgi:hypothetical protein
MTDLSFGSYKPTYKDKCGEDQTIPLPDNFTMQDFQDTINAAALAGKNGETNDFLFQHFTYGGGGDLQRPNGGWAATWDFKGTQNGKPNFDGRYTPAAGYLYGAAAAAAGVPVDEALHSAGWFNKLSTDSGAKDKNGLPDERTNQIRRAYSDYQNGAFKPDASTPTAVIDKMRADDNMNLPGADAGMIKGGANALSKEHRSPPSPAAVCPTVPTAPPTLLPGLPDPGPGDGVHAVARGSIGSSKYITNATNDDLGAGVQKDAQFVGDMLNQAGLGFDSKVSAWPTAAQWADPTQPIANWSVVDGPTQAGDVLATAKGDMSKGAYFRPGQQMGIATGNDSSIGVHDNGTVAETDWGFRPDDAPTIRRYDGGDTQADASPAT